MKRIGWIFGCATVLAAIIFLTNGANAQRSKKKEPYDVLLWKYLNDNKYRNWAPVPGESDDAYEGESPHGAYLKMYLNRKAAGSPNDRPSGSISVKENFAKDKTTLMAVTVMFKSYGFNEDGGDWYWAKYNANGTIAKTDKEAGSKRISGKVGKCIDCHGDAKGEDFVFFNDED